MRRPQLCLTTREDGKGSLTLWSLDNHPVTTPSSDHTQAFQLVGEQKPVSSNVMTGRTASNKAECRLVNAKPSSNERD